VPVHEFFFGRHVYFLGWTPQDHPPPKPPFQCLHPNQMGTIMFLFKLCTLIKTWSYNAAELWGRNWDTGAHAHMTHQAPITGLHNSTLLPFFQNSTDNLMLAQSWKFGGNCCSIGLTHPAACTGALVPLTFRHVHRTPFTQFAQKGWQSTGLELRFPMTCLEFRMSGPEKIWRPPPKLKPHQGITPPPPSRIQHIYTNW